MNIITYVSKGIFFFKFDGIFDEYVFNQFDEKVNYLLYKHGVSFYSFDFSYVNQIDDGLIAKIQNKLIEIFLNCGQVVMCGLNQLYQEKIGKRRNHLYYVNNVKEAFQLINL